MKPAPVLSKIACIAALATGTLVIDRRVVDIVEVGNVASEAAHGYAGNDVTMRFANGKPCRQARGWMRYALHTFDDTEVTVALTLVATDSVVHSYDVTVEDSVIATRTFTPQPNMPVSVVQITVPFAVTKGKTNIAVVVRAHGGTTPALRELRTIQDHNEVETLHRPLGVTR